MQVFTVAEACPGGKSCQDLVRILPQDPGMFLCGILTEDPIESCSQRILCRILKNPVGSCEDYDPKHIMYITGSLTESCKILTKGFNKK